MYLQRTGFRHAGQEQLQQRVEEEEAVHLVEDQTGPIVGQDDGGQQVEKRLLEGFGLKVEEAVAKPFYISI